MVILREVDIATDYTIISKPAYVQFECPLIGVTERGVTVQIAVKLNLVTMNMIRRNIV